MRVMFVKTDTEESVNTDGMAVVCFDSDALVWEGRQRLQLTLCYS